MKEIHIVNCLKVALSSMKSKIITNEKSSIGVIFFGTKHNSESSPKGIYTLFRLEAPSAARIRKLQAMVDDMSIFEEKIGSAEGEYCPLKEAFWECSGAFSSRSSSHKQNDWRRIWLFTNDDHPNRHDPSLMPGMIQACRDCWDGKIELSLWHINRTGHGDFQPAKFYLKLLRVGDEEGGEEDSVDQCMKGAGYDNFEDMMKNVKKKDHRKRRLGSLLFSLNPDVQMAFQMYKTISISKKPTHTWLHSRTGEPLKVPLYHSTPLPLYPTTTRPFQHSTTLPTVSLYHSTILPQYQL